MYISAFPTLTVQQIIASPIRTQVPFQSLKMWGFGRSAIYAAVRALNMRSTEAILMPAYHCGVEVEVVRRAGVDVVFYDLRKDGSVDIEDLRSRCDGRTRAIFLIHYYGFPQPMEPIQALCRERGLYLVEDCAHAFLSSFNGKWLGKFGDAAIYSIRKSLPVPDGGALLINNPRLRVSPPRELPNRRTTARATTLLFLEGVRMHAPGWVAACTQGFLKLGRWLLGAAKTTTGSATLGMVVPSAWEFLPSMGNLGMSRFSRRVLKRADFKSIIQERRNNYTALAAAIKDIPGLEVWSGELSEGVCPLVLPIRVSKRGRLREGLARRGIGTYVMGDPIHPSVPREDFPISALLSAQILGLPVHQDIRPPHIEYMAETLRLLQAR